MENANFGFWRENANLGGKKLILEEKLILEGKANFGGKKLILEGKS